MTTRPYVPPPLRAAWDTMPPCTQPCRMGYHATMHTPCRLCVFSPQGTSLEDRSSGRRQRSRAATPGHAVPCYVTCGSKCRSRLVALGLQHCMLAFERWRCACFADRATHAAACCSDLIQHGYHLTDKPKAVHSRTVALSFRMEAPPPAAQGGSSAQTLWSLQISAHA